MKQHRRLMFSPGYVKDGLITFFDFRSCDYNNTVKSGGSSLTKIYSTDGTPMSTYTWANNAVTSQNLIKGISNTGRWHVLASTYNGTSTYITPPEYTIITMGFNAIPAPHNTTDTITGGLKIGARFTNTSGTQVGSTAQNIIGEVSSGNGKWNTLILRASGDTTDIWVNGTLKTSINKSDCTDWASWATNIQFRTIVYSTAHFLTLYGLYNRGLTDAEIAKTFAFMDSIKQ